MSHQPQYHLDTQESLAILSYYNGGLTATYTLNGSTVTGPARAALLLPVDDYLARISDRAKWDVMIHQAFPLLACPHNTPQIEWVFENKTDTLRLRIKRSTGGPYFYDVTYDPTGATVDLKSRQAISMTWVEWLFWSHLISEFGQMIRVSRVFS